MQIDHVTVNNDFNLSVAIPNISKLMEIIFKMFDWNSACVHVWLRQSTFWHYSVQRMCDNDRIWLISWKEISIWHIANQINRFCICIIRISGQEIIEWIENMTKLNPKSTTFNCLHSIEDVFIECCIVFIYL